MISLQKMRLAAIDIGSSAVRMTIAEFSEDKYRILEEVRQPLPLGRDSFEKGTISHTTIQECLRILRHFVEKCSELKTSRIRATATTSIYGTENRDIFLDYMRSGTGLEVEIISPVKSSEFMYKALTHFSGTIQDGLAENEYAGIMETGSGSIILTFLDREFLVFTRSIPTGTFKIRNSFERLSRSDRNFGLFLKTVVDHELANVKRDVSSVKLKKLFAVSPEMSAAVKLVSKNDKDGLPFISSEQMKELYAKYSVVPEYELAKKAGFPRDLTTSFSSSLYIHFRMSEFFGLDGIFIPQITLRDGIILDTAKTQNDKVFYEKLVPQVRLNALNIGRSLNFYEVHALKVSDLACSFFDQTLTIHKLGNKEKAYLVVAAVLHDIGARISYRAHHKHSQYIIRAQEFFHFNDTERNIIGNIARYHRRSGPKETHPEYKELEPKDRMTVMKLAAMLRIADSLDNAHSQAVRTIKVVREKNILVCEVQTDAPLTTEAYSFDSKKSLFEDFYGMELKLRVVR